MASEAMGTSLASKEEEEEKEKEEEDHPNTMETLANSGFCRKEKRKVAKKMKRKQIRKEIAEKERAEEEARLNDLEEQRRLRLKEQEEAEIMEMQRKEFEERERLWMERAAAKLAEEKAQRELQQQQQEEEAKRKQVENDIDLDEDDGWEYVEEGPAEIIWQGNEIIVKKKRVRVAKKNADEQLRLEDADRPTSNPLPPQSEVFANYKNASSASTQQVFDSVAQQIPNFGTEQDKAHCPFHIKTGACRFGSRCSRVHFYPDKSCTLLMKNMYNGPGLAWDQDEGLEHTDEEVEHSYEEFYEDVHTEFLKFGEIVNFKVCRNGSFHLRGNVYVHYKLLESAVGAYNSINGRYFAGKQITCEFVGVTRWKVAICGEYMKSRLKTCSRGTACNFIHCFRNPGGDYEWADWDNPPPKYWMKKMVSLFGPSNEIGYDGYMDPESWQKLKNSPNETAANHNRYQSRRSRSRSSAVDYVSSGSDDHSDGKGEQQSTRSSTHRHSSRSGRKRSLFRENERCENLSNYEDEKGLVRSNFGDNFGRDRNRDRNCTRSSHFRKEIDYLDDQNLNEQSTSNKDRLHRNYSSRKTSRRWDHLRGRLEEDIRHNMSYLSNSPGRYDPNSGHNSDLDQLDHRETTSYSSEHEKFRSRRHIGDHDLQDKQRLESHRESSGEYYEKKARHRKLPSDEKPSDNHKEKSDPSEVAHHGVEKQESGRRNGRSSDWKQDQRRNKHRGKINNEGFSNGVGESKERSNSELLKKMTEISDENGSSGRKERCGRKKSKENIDKKTSEAGLDDRKLKDSEKRLRSRSPVQSSSRSRRKIGQCNDP